jgi:hypothetical protein
MASNLAAAPASLDVGTLFFIAICVTGLLGLFLLYAWTQERIRALAWWSAAYLIGAASGALCSRFTFEHVYGSLVPRGRNDFGAVRAYSMAGRFVGSLRRSVPRFG